MLRYSSTTVPPVRPRKLRFGLLSAAEIQRTAVCEVTETTLYYRGLPATGGLLDPLMGTVDRRHMCATCMKDAKRCQGHAGYLRLAFPAYHLGFVDVVLRVLRCVCYGCARPCLTEEEMADLATHTDDEELVCGKARLAAVHAVARNRKTCPHCGMPHPSYARTSLGIKVDWPADDAAWECDEERLACAERVFTARDALSILCHVSDEDARFLGFDPTLSHPHHLVLQNMVVPPPCTRPAIYSSEGSRSRGQNDLTVRFLEILKRSHEVSAALGPDHDWRTLPEVTPEVLERIHRLQYEVYMLVNNSARIPKPPGMGRNSSNANGKSLFQRLKGKEGRVRGNLMGKRVDFSARCVITPDAYFECDRVGVPYKIAMSLTVPERVNPTNVQALSKRVRLGAAHVRGAQSVVHVDGTVTDLANREDRSDLLLRSGDVVERYLSDEDVVVFNRQPSLHMHGMQAHRVRLMPGHTFRISLVVAAPYNADFDGDEMNLHVPQSLAAAAECATLMGVTQNCVGPQSNRPVMGIVQDSLLGLHLLSQQDTLLDHAHACRLLGVTRHVQPRRLPPPAVVVLRGETATRYWTGKQLFSTLLPQSLFVESAEEKKGSKEDWAVPDAERPVLVRGGLLLAGVLRKPHVGTGAGGIVDTLCRDGGGVACMRFMADAQRITHEFLLQRGHHVGIDDVMLSSEGHIRVHERLEKATTLCEEIQRELVDAPASVAAEGEAAILRLLSKSLLQTGGIVHEHMSERNAIRRMVTAGSKGSFINLSQICAALGQQSLEGGRIVATKGHRTLPCFAHKDPSLASRGMVHNSFALGLSPPELFFHAIGGREGLVDTAVKTSQTGYLQRRMNKSMEDNSVHPDGTVRNALGDIVSFRWGSDGMHPARLERVKLGVLRETEESLRARMTEEESALCLAARARILRVKTHVLVPEFDPRVLLPFNPHRVRRRVAREEDEKDENESSAERSRLSARVLALARDGPDTVCAALLDVLCASAVANVPTPSLSALLDELEDRIAHAKATEGESVGCIAAQSIGEPATQMTLNSVDWHTTMVLHWTSKDGPPPAPQDAEVGAFVDALIAQRPEDCQVMPDGQTIYLPLPPGTALALSPQEDGTMVWTELEAVTRHPPINEDGSRTLVEVKTESGRTVTVTKGKSLLVEDGGALLPKGGDEVRVGDRVPVVHALPASEESSSALPALLDLHTVFAAEEMPPTTQRPLDRAFGLLVGAYLSSSDEGEEEETAADETTRRLLRCTCGSTRRRVPGFAFAAPDAFVRGLLENTEPNKTTTTPHEDKEDDEERLLRDGLSLLRARFSDTAAAPSSSTLRDVRLERIVSLTEVASSHEFVYDLTVAGTRNMTATSGFAVRDTFHSAGVSAKNVTLGIPRLKEVIDASKSPKTPCTTLRFLAPYASSAAFADYVARTLPLTRLGDVVARCDILHDPDPWRTVVSEDAWVVECERLLRCEGEKEEEAKKTPSDDCKHVVRLELLQEVMRARHLTPPMVRSLLAARLEGRATVLSSEVNAVDWVVRVRFRQVGEMMRVGGLAAEQEALLCHRAVNVLLDTVVVSGHPGVTGATAAEVTRSDGQTEHVVHAYGSVLVDAAALHCVDWAQCTSNDLWEVYHTLGIEACANVVFEQIKAVVSFDGTYVDDRHLLTIVDSMCRGGTLMPLNRHGINRTDASPLMRCSFEETMDVLCNAAVFSDVENARSVTASIMTGQLSSLGTGTVDARFRTKTAPIREALRVPPGTVLRSTCRSYIPPTESEEVVEYVFDDPHPGGTRPLSPPTLEGAQARKRARFRPTSPTCASSHPKAFSRE